MNESESEIEKKIKILIIGISGGLAQITTRLLLHQLPEAEVVGVDSRDTSHVPHIPGLTAQTMKYSRGNFENLFRNHKFDYVFHLARFTHIKNSHQDLAKRIDINVMGTSRILELCLRFKVKKVVVLSTFHVYGALPDNPVFIKEEYPLRASARYAELRDVVEMDQVCTSWMWKYQNQISTVVLRPCNIVGPQIQNAFVKFLSSHYSVYPIDYNPMFQFIHEFDMAHVLVKCLEIPTGIYNVAGEQFISIREALRLSGSEAYPFPMSIAKPFAKLAALAGKNLPDYLIDYMKYSCLIDTKAIRPFLGENFFRYSVKDTLLGLKPR